MKLIDYYFQQIEKFLVRSLVATLVILTCPLPGSAQQLGQFTQYISNELIINPAYAGAEDALSTTLVYRSQWVGLEGSPSSQTFTAHSLFKNKNVGLGLSIINDKIGVHNSMTVFSSYSYRLRFSDQSYLAMGLQFGFKYLNSDYASLFNNPQLAIDPNLLAATESQTSFEFGSGIYYRNQGFEISLSVPELLVEKMEGSDSLNLPINNRNYFLLSRIKMPLNHNVRLQPGILIKYVQGRPLSYDINLSTVLKDVLLLGISYRSLESIDLIFQAKITPQLKFGYSYDFPLSQLSEISRSSHEIMLNYVFKFSNKGITAPR